MKLSNISIRNLKGIREGGFNPTTFACLVGENNAGKSTVLQAVTYALNRPSQLPDQLYYDAQLPILVELGFTGITAADIARLAEEHRARIEPLVIDGSFTLKVSYRIGEKVEIKTARLVPNEPRYQQETINAVFAGKTGAAVRAALIESYPEFAQEVPDGAMNQGQAKAFLSAKLGELPPEAFALADAPLPTGISSSITAFLPEVIYIPAVKNLSDDLKTTQSTSFGRLLGLLLDDMTPDLAAINQSLQELDGMLNRIVVEGDVVDGRHEKVKELENTVEEFLSENFPLVKVELSIPRPELRTILNAAQIYVNDGSKDLIDNKGDGIKRSLTFALLQTFVLHLAARNQVAAEQEQEVAPRPLLFLFEEPELYLHPKSQRVLFGTLARIAETHQVIVTTHSPLFFAPGVTASFVRVAKRAADPKPVGVLYPVDLTLDQASAEAFRLARFENADAAFFSRRVVLFEGESDDAYCRHIAKTLNANWDFDAKNIAMVRVSGKGNFAKYRRFFESFGIEVKIVADLDALFEGYQHLGVPAEVSPIRAETIAGIDARIEALGIRAEPATRQIKDQLGKESWRQRYSAAKDAVGKLSHGEALNEDIVKALDDLFVWEKDIARVKACREDIDARNCLVPVLDAMRASGISVLSKGAIEDYYPADTPGTSKPDRALSACSLVAGAQIARGLSASLAPDREPELCEIFAEIFLEP
ncbi:AAA family ATPase [Mesorhizobium microcysteis]|uniref:AAA family ATPase n=1 Tax=Neoaquamicrobium microcysteis TaxID=2682781 RepID=A0A5D4GZB5_9HYPH|nr:AAA family ATPase [Mesorhizobium microcysteis]TYR33524.1 AAA family ATPase [Mesorhizobium microcysteis]